MKIAVIGSRNIPVNNIGTYLSGVSEIVSGGATGVDSCAAEYAEQNGIKLTLFLPEYARYGRAAPIVLTLTSILLYSKMIAHYFFVLTLQKAFVVLSYQYHVSNRLGIL